ncbi:MAG TPA: class I SAM-dependent methyltransferase [Candidatus Acidoferrales bacterium]|nr:class I SAM-dependent methyltransferase [Candidatus Acidoferrales bacterium]
MHSRISDHRNPRSLAAKLRARRSAFFHDLLCRVPKPITILDVGGTADFWKRLAFANDGLNVILLNMSASMIDDPRFESVVGDARDLSAFGSGSIDVVYSNSVIEHVGTFADQRRMAEEVRRVGKRYFVQTPNAWFPIEPHFLVPGFQFMPLELRAFLLSRARLGWIPREPDHKAAREIVDSIHLLTERQMRNLFPEALLYREKFLGMTKSVISYHGW